jgi:hypothetical protein
MIFAITAPVVVGVCGFGGEVGYWYYKERGLQSAADIAAYNGVVALKGGSTSSQITSSATTGATSNGWSSTGGTIAVNSPPTSGTHRDAFSVQVDLTQTLPRFFSAMYSSSPVVASAHAVGTAASSSGACVLALNPTANQAINISGSANLHATNCDVVADSNSSSAINMSGSAQMTADCAVTVGTANTTSGLTLTKCTSVTAHSTAVPDPYASVTQPTPSGTCLTVPNGATTLSPGWYCHGLSTSWGPITFQSGLYMVTGGGFNLNAGTTATGTGVTFFIGSGNQSAVTGSANVTFSAPASGDYAGILYFGDRNATNGNNAFSGSSVSSTTGAIYFPTQPVTYSGGATNGANCTQIVAGTITISGSAYFNHTCSGSGEAAINLMDGQTGSMRVVE